MDFTSSSSITSILNETDLQSIPSNVRTIIDNHLEGRSKILELENQRRSLLEKDYNELKIKVDYQSDLMNRYKSHITQLEDDLHKARRELCDSKHEKDCLNVEIKNLNFELSSKDDHLTKLNELIKAKNEETINLIETNRKLQIDLDHLRKETNSTELSEQHFNNLINEKEKLFGLECNFLKEELDRITNDFHEKCSKLNSLTSEMTIFKNETEIKLNDLKKENSSFKNQNTFLNSLIEKKDVQINELANKLNELNQHQDLLKEQYNIEKKEQTDLINYFKKLLEDSKKQKTELIEKIKELHASFTESNENQKLAFEKLNEQSLRHSEEIQFKDKLNLELQRKIEDLELQLINSNQKEIDTAMKHFYPTSNTLSKMFEKNMPLSTIYSKYEEVQSKCEELLNENDELKVKIQEMIDESEKNAPLIFYKTQENKKACVEIENYKAQLCKVSSDLENALSEIENYNKINNYLKRELKRYEKSNVDLTRQVQCLIQTVHEIKGNFVSNKFLINDDHLEKESSFDRAISINLVTFKNIEEIHENNKKLLSTIRELSEQYQELQDKFHNGDDQTAKKRIDELLVEIENLKEENRHKQEILSEMMTERETNLNSSNSITNKHDSSAMKEKQGATLFKITSRAYLEEKIVELTSNLDKKIEEFEQFKNQAKLHEDELNNKIKEHLKQITNYQNEVSKLTVKFDSLNENHKVLDSTLARYNKDIGLLKERNIKLEEQRKTLKERIGTFEAKKNELIAKLEEMKKELDSKSKIANLLEKENDHLKLEKTIIKSRIDELKVELKESNRELNEVKATSKIEPVRIQTELKGQIQILEIKLSNLERQVAVLSKEKEELINKMNVDQKNAQTNIFQMKQKVLAMTKEKVEFTKEKDRISQLYKECQDRLNEIQNSADDIGNKNKLQKSLIDLKNQLDAKKKEIIKLTEERNDLIEKLKKSEIRGKSYFEVAHKQISRFEESVENQTSNLKKQLESQTSDLKKQLESQTSNLKKQLEESHLREKILKSKFESMLNGREKELKEVKEKLTKLQQKQSSSTENEQKLLLSSKSDQQHTISITPIIANKPITASIKPLQQSLQTMSRIQPIPQATIPPQTQITITNSPQTAYVAPTSVEISNVESISSSIASTSFSVPSSNVLASNQEEKQFKPNLSSNQLKRARVSSIEDSSSKKVKMNLISTPSQQIDSNLEISSKNDQIEQAISNSLNDQEMFETEEIEKPQESITENQTINEQLSQISKESELLNKSQNTVTTDENQKETFESSSNIRDVASENNLVETNQDEFTEIQEEQQEEQQDEQQDEQQKEQQKEEQAEETIDSSMIVERIETNEQESRDDNSEASSEDDEETSDEESESDDQNDEEYDEDEEEQNDIDQNLMNEENQQTQESQNNDQDRDDSDIICLSDEDENSQDRTKNVETDLNQQTDSNSLNEESNSNVQQNLEANAEEESEAIKNLNIMFKNENEQTIDSNYNLQCDHNYHDDAVSSQKLNDDQLDDQEEESSEQQKSFTNQSQLNMPILTNLSKLIPFETEKNQNVDYSSLVTDETPDLEEEKLVINMEPTDQITGIELADEGSNNESDFVTMVGTEIKTTTNRIQNQLTNQTQQASTSSTSNTSKTSKTNQNKKLRRPQITITNQPEQQTEKKTYSIMNILKKDKPNDS